MSVNKVIIVGRLGKDPELKYSNSGVPIAKFSVATSEKYKGEEKTEWHNIITINNTAENCAKFLSKGSLAYIDGKIQTRKYTDKNGIEKYITEIVANNVKFLNSKGSNQTPTPTPTPTPTQSQSSFNSELKQSYDEGGVVITDNDDDLPF